MMTEFLQYSVWTAAAISLVVLSQALIARACRRNPALARWHLLLAVTGLLWCLVVVLKLRYFDVNMEQGDGLSHEWVGRYVASCLVDGKFALAMDEVRPGNPGYRFILGVFYALTNAPPGCVYAINGVFGFWAMLTLLEILCRSTGCTRVPWWVVAMTVGLPSAVYWTTANMKEGLVLWGICMMLRLAIPGAGRSSPSQRALLPFAGFLTTSFLRPHIAIAWLGAIATSTLVCQKRIAAGILCGAGIFVAFVLLQIIAPEHMASAQEDGVTVMMSETFEGRHQGGSAIYRSRPVIPVVSGLALVFLRPLPHECRDIRDILAGGEVWVISLVSLWGWLMLRNRRRGLNIPLVVTSIIATVGLSFLFSYTYNMGLMARQRIQVLPALVVLATVPFLISTNRQAGRHSRSGRGRMDPRHRAVRSPRVLERKRPAAAPREARSTRATRGLKL